MGATPFPPGRYLGQAPQTNKKKPNTLNIVSHNEETTFRSSGPRMVGFFPILDMMIAILSHPMMHLALYARTGRYHGLSPSTDTLPSSSGHYSLYRQGSNSVYTVPRP